MNTISEKYQKDIHDFIRNRLEKERKINREIEAFNKFKVRTTLGKILKRLQVESPIEEILRNALLMAGLGKHLRTQFKIGAKRVDFAFPIARLAVEADGKEYHRADILQLEKDLERDKYLARRGWRVLHIEGLAIRRNIQLCVEKIKEELGEKVASLIHETMGKMKHEK